MKWSESRSTPLERHPRTISRAGWVSVPLDFELLLSTQPPPGAEGGTHPGAAGPAQQAALLHHSYRLTTLPTYLSFLSCVFSMPHLWIRTRS